VDVFQLRNQLIEQYSAYASSFIHINDPIIEAKISTSLAEGAFWPEPLIQLNPMFQPGATVTKLVDQGILHPACDLIFRMGKSSGIGKPLQFHQHQLDALIAAQANENYILTTGTGSGKSLSYIVPIVDHVLRNGSGKGVQAIIVYPMNALANSQSRELEKFLGADEQQRPVSFAVYTGQENDVQRQRILANPPDIILTNYVMLELMMTRPRERTLIDRIGDLRFLVLDELHTYRGRQGADVALLVRRVRERLQSGHLLCVGTSATLASEGTLAERRVRVAEVGTQLFGVTVKPGYVIDETLQRATPPFNLSDAAFNRTLTKAIQIHDLVPPTAYHAFVDHPLSRWIETTFGVIEAEGRLIRQLPRKIGEVAQALSDLTGVHRDRCAEVIQRWLLAGYQCEPNPATGFRPFAFRLHQFISPADTLYATLQTGNDRYLTLEGQRFAPGDRDRVLFPLCFCRECGQEYYLVRSTTHRETHKRQFTPRGFSDRLTDDQSEAGYLYLNDQIPWPINGSDELIGKLPDDWIEQKNSSFRVKSQRKEQLPEQVTVGTEGFSNYEGHEAAYIAAPFQFCLNCGVAYGARQGDFGKLAPLSSEGRSSATTILSLSTILTLRDSDLVREAQKLLSFTDNRQDASLQAGHFNDFIEVGLLRGAIYRAAVKAGKSGLRHETIAQQVFDALNLPLDLYASDPEVRFAALENTKIALQHVLGYRIYRDLRRGWRVMSPNLEQCGLLQIDYLSLDEVCEAQDIWQTSHHVLADSSAGTRAKIARVLLDYMRRELAIKVDYLTQRYQEQVIQSGSQRLKGTWLIDENERLEYASVLLPRPSGSDKDDSRASTYLSARGGFGQYLRRAGTFPTLRPNDRLTLDETQQIIRQLLEGLRMAGLVEIVQERRNATDVPGYQLLASAMIWRAGDGTAVFHDPIRVPRPPAIGSEPNRFYVDFYRAIAKRLMGMEAKEHTAQVPMADRVAREEQFRSGKLPILYCSPTMELGVDIAELNVVNLRNVPPTPANYAQRSGRAGRSGQPALVFTYCAKGSAHDQYFFKRPDMMVAGSVAPPRLDLTNEDLLRAHIHAVWLGEANLDLGETLKTLLDMHGQPPTLALNAATQDRVQASAPRQRTAQRAWRILENIAGLDQTTAQTLIESTLHTVEQSFNHACDRWRDLYLAAYQQSDTQGRVIRDASRPAEDKRQAERLRREAEAQLKLLTEIDQLAQSDFYSYRYFATEGFLPGYSFPRLPISAFIPARRTKQRDEFLSRPRFLAIAEFGPRAIIYHEGSRYLINQVIMPVSGIGEESEPITQEVKPCPNCGYLHVIVKNQHNPDLCVQCGHRLENSLRSLLRLQNVVTKRRDRINCDEEERLRLGYEIRTGIQFPERNGKPSVQTAVIKLNGEPLVKLTYAQAGTIWRINLGWARRKNRFDTGFVLDLERGYWGRNEQIEDDPTDPVSQRTQKVIPYVNDKRNCLLFEPLVPLTIEQMASLQAVLKRAIEAYCQLEDNELAAEPLPDSDNRHLILFYEAAEGGAGVLRRLIDEPQMLSHLASEALDICHYDPRTGEDLHHAPRSNEDCEAACYYCLLSYSNQRDHDCLDRRLIFDTLRKLQSAHVVSSPTAITRTEQVTRLKHIADSDLEREWIDYLDACGYRLPDRSQVLIEDCQTRPDFLYSTNYVAIYIDGNPHLYAERRARDRQQTTCMENFGYTVIRFGVENDWDAVLSRHPSIFGQKER